MDFLPIFSLIASSLVIFAAFWALIKPKSSKNLPPGPPKLPIIGNIHQLKGAAPHRVLRSLARKYGAPLMHLQLGQVSTMVVSTPRLAQEILTTYDQIFSSRVATTASQILFYKGQDIVWAPHGKYWRQMRKICALELLSPKRVQTYSYIREEELIRMRTSLESSAGRPVIIKEMVVEMVNNVICRATLGDICKNRKILIKVLYDTLKALSAFNLTSYFPSMQFLNVISGKKSKWLKMQKQLDMILEDILEEHQNRSCANNDQEDLVDVLLRVQKTADLDLPITKDNIKAVILDMLLGGTSTASRALEWGMVELMRKPEIMKKVQAELRTTVKENTIAEVDIQNMPYLKSIVKETLRLHGSALLIARENKEDCQVNGYDIPAKTRLIINAWACGTDPEYWENPESFIPERFDNSNSISYLNADYQLLPFGGGRRACPGMNFGLGIIEYALATLLYYFDWELPNGLKPDEVDMTEATVLSTLLKHPLEVIPTPVSSLLVD